MIDESDDVDALLDFAHNAGWRAEWVELALPSRGWRATLIQPHGAPISAFGATRGEACRSLVRRLTITPLPPPTTT